MRFCSLNKEFGRATPILTMKQIATTPPKSRECLRFAPEVSQALHALSLNRRTKRPPQEPYEKQAIVEAALVPYLKRAGALKV